MRAALLIVLVIALGIGVAIIQLVRKRKRREAFALFALQNKLEYAQEDLFGLTGYPFRLLQMGDGRGCENVVYGDWQGLPVMEADYWYYTTSTDSNGNRTKQYHDYSIVIADMGLRSSYVSVQRETLMTKLADHVGLRDIEFESEDFNRTFNVKGEDKEYVFKVVDARMIRWLLSIGDAFGFEVQENALLVACKRRSPAELIPLLGAAKGFRDHVPRLVWNEYGTGTPPPPPLLAGEGPESERSST